VRIGDISVYNGTSATQLRRRVGMVFQKPNPFPTMSIYDNVASGLKLNGFRDRKKLDEVVQGSLNSAALWDEVKDQSAQKSGASLSEASSSACASPVRWRCSPKCCSWMSLLGTRPDLNRQNRGIDFSVKRAIHQS